MQRLSKDELIDLVLRLQRPEKTSRTSSKPPSTDRKERRDKAKPGGAKPGHKGHSRALSEDFDCVVDHYPDQCLCCRAGLSSDLSAETVSEHETIDLPEIRPVVVSAQPRPFSWRDDDAMAGVGRGRGSAIRCGHQALALMVQTALKLDPHSGVTVIFRSKRGDRLKILVWDGSGMVLIYKILEHGNFA